ncbi:MAG: hypothetical protein ACJ788_25780, partial [Ktedonobacteraceae bacterium]
MPRRQRREAAECYLCEKWCNSPTDDHVPPECLAPNALQTDFIKVPACKGCNNYYQKIENYFRDFLVNAVRRGKNRSADAAYEKFLRSVQRNDIGRAGRPHRDLQRVMKGMGIAQHYTIGDIYVGQSQFIHPSADVHTSALLVKIARGIHYHHSGKVQPFGQRVYVQRIGQDEFTTFASSQGQMHCRQLVGQPANSLQKEGGSERL